MEKKTKTCCFFFTRVTLLLLLLLRFFEIFYFLSNQTKETNATFRNSSRLDIQLLVVSMSSIEFILCWTRLTCTCTFSIYLFSILFVRLFSLFDVYTNTNYLYPSSSCSSVCDENIHLPYLLFIYIHTHKYSCLFSFF